MLKSVKMQLNYIIRRKAFLGTFCFIMILVLYNYITNMNYYKGLEISQMYSHLKLSTLSRWTAVGYYLMQYYPLLLAIPTACLFYNDKNTRISNYIQTRISYRQYIYGKLIAAFVVTFLVFVIPLLLEIIVYKIIIPGSANGDPSNFPYYQTIESDNRIFLPSLYYKNTYIYTMSMIVIFGVISAVLATFNLALTLLPFFKFRIILYLPVYIFFYLIGKLTEILNYNFETNYFSILRIFEKTDNWNLNFYLILICIIIMVTLAISEFRIRKGMIL